MYDNKSSINYILFRYTDAPNEIEIEKLGEGGLEELKELLFNDKIQFSVVQENLTSEYSVTSRFALLQWIGQDVPAGMMKARASSHRNELITFCKKILPIGGELQASSKEEITENSVNSSFGSNNKSDSNQNNNKTGSVGDMRGGRGRVLETLRYSNEEQISQILKQIHSGELSWAILAYSQTEAGVIELVESGQGGAEELAKRYPTNRIFFCPISVPIKPNNKYALVTCVGNSVPPLQKARCSGFFKSQQFSFH